MSRLAIEERQIQGGGFYWRSLAEALGTTSDGLLYWDKFGRSKEIYMPDESMAAQLDDPELMVQAISLLAEACNFTLCRSVFNHQYKVTQMQCNCLGSVYRALKFGKN